MAHSVLDGDRVSLSFLNFAHEENRFRRPIALVLAVAALALATAPARAEPNVAAPPPKPAVKEKVGTLVIVGGGKLPDAILQRFLELAGGKKGRLVVIPTASRQIHRIFDYWKTQDLASVTLLHTLDRKVANDPVFVRPLTEATAAWLSGGDQNWLSDAYRGTAVERELHRLLARGGVIGGTSAGAAVMSRVMIAGGNPQARVGTGFGFVPDAIVDQHFQKRKRQKRLLGMLTRYRHCLGLGIDEQTALVVRGHQFTVIGNANVLLCLPPSAHEPAIVNRVLKSGESGDLAVLQRDVLARLKSAEPPSTAKAP